MKIGIISEPVRKTNYSDNILYRLCRRFGIPLRKIYFNEFKLFCVRNNTNGKKSIICEFDFEKPNDLELLYTIDAVGAEIPYGGSELRDFSEKSLKKYMSECLSYFREIGINRILFTDGIKDIYETEKLSEKMFKGGFSKAVICSISEVTDGISRKCGVESETQSLGIVCSHYSEELRRVVRLLITGVKFIRIYTYKAEEFSEMCEEFYNSFGIFIEVCDYKCVSEVRDNIVCDFDLGILKVGRDIVITDIKYGIDICGYAIKDIELIDIIDEKADEFKIKYCVSGKNRLTI